MKQPEQDRRKANTDRRSKTRQGKYDRRRNRCGACAQFEPRGFCRWHQMAVQTDTFACLDFEPKDPSGV